MNVIEQIEAAIDADGNYAGNITLDGCIHVASLPERLRFVSGSIYVQGSGIQTLPAGLCRVGGDLDARDTDIEELPESLAHVGEALRISGTRIKQLPESLKYVGESLYAEGLGIALPDDLEVGGRVTL